MYYKIGVPPEHTGEEKYQHTWKISGTEYDTSTDRDALEARRRSEEEEKFLVEIRINLIQKGKRLVLNEKGICQVVD